MKAKVDHILTLKEVKEWVKTDAALKTRLDSFKQMAEVRAKGGLLFCKELGIDPATDQAGVIFSTCWVLIGAGSAMQQARRGWARGQAAGTVSRTRSGNTAYMTPALLTVSAM